MREEIANIPIHTCNRRWADLSSQNEISKLMNSLLHSTIKLSLETNFKYEKKNLFTVPF